MSDRPRPERPKPERIRALIEEVDRVFRETESVTGGADQSMKQGQFWPERRKVTRFSQTEPGLGPDDDAA